MCKNFALAVADTIAKLAWNDEVANSNPARMKVFVFIIFCTMKLGEMCIVGLVSVSSASNLNLIQNRT